jgi:hypothetical protein
MKMQRDAIGNIIEVLNFARKEVKICSGELKTKICDDTMILDKLKETLKRGVKIEVLVGPEISSKYLTEIEGIDIYSAPGKPGLSFVVSDSENIRVEQPNKNIFRKGDKTTAKYLEFKFKEALIDSKKRIKQENKSNEC